MSQEGMFIQLGLLQSGGRILNREIATNLQPTTQTPAANHKKAPIIDAKFAENPPK